MGMQLKQYINSFILPKLLKSNVKENENTVLKVHDEKIKNLTKKLTVRLNTRKW